MLQAIKKLFTRDRSVELQLIAIIKQQQEFISKNINERVVYVDPQSGYTNAERFDDPNAEKNDEEDDDFDEPMDLTPDQLREQMEHNDEPKNEEGEK